MLVNASPTVLNQYWENFKSKTEDQLRLDRIIQKVYHEPSSENIRELAEWSFIPLMAVSATTVLGPAFGVYMLAMNLLMSAAIETWLCHQDLSGLSIPSDFFSKGNPIWKLFLGVIAWFPFVILENNLTLFITWLMGLMGIVVSGAQDVGILLGSGGLSGILWVAFGCILAPVMEEIIFRGYLESWFQQDEDPSIFQRFKTAFKTNAIFGAVHMSPFQGWFNLPIFISTFTMGMAFSLLKEMTGDLWAPVSLHIMNNTAATVALRMV